MGFHNQKQKYLLEEIQRIKNEHTLGTQEAYQLIRFRLKYQKEAEKLRENDGISISTQSLIKIAEYLTEWVQNYFSMRYSCLQKENIGKYNLSNPAEEQDIHWDQVLKTSNSEEEEKKIAVDYRSFFRSLVSLMSVITDAQTLVSLDKWAEHAVYLLDEWLKGTVKFIDLSDFWVYPISDVDDVLLKHSSPWDENHPDFQMSVDVQRSCWDDDDTELYLSHFNPATDNIPDGLSDQEVFLLYLSRKGEDNIWKMKRILSFFSLILNIQDPHLIEILSSSETEVLYNIDALFNRAFREDKLFRLETEREIAIAYCHMRIKEIVNHGNGEIPNMNSEHSVEEFINDIIEHLEIIPSVMKLFSNLSINTPLEQVMDRLTRQYYIYSRFPQDVKRYFLYRMLKNNKRFLVKYFMS